MPELEVFVHMLPLAAGVFQQELPVKPTNGREDVQQEHNARALLTLMGSEWAKVPKEKLPVHPHCTIRDVRIAAGRKPDSSGDSGAPGVQPGTNPRWHQDFRVANNAHFLYLRQVSQNRTFELRGGRHECFSDI